MDNDVIRAYRCIFRADRLLRYLRSFFRDGVHFNPHLETAIDIVVAKVLGSSSWEEYQPAPFHFVPFSGFPVSSPASSLTCTVLVVRHSGDDVGSRARCSSRRPLRRVGGEQTQAARLPMWATRSPLLFPFRRRASRAEPLSCDESTVIPDPDSGVLICTSCGIIHKTTTPAQQSLSTSPPSPTPIVFQELFVECGSVDPDNFDRREMQGGEMEAKAARMEELSSTTAFMEGGAQDACDDACSISALRSSPTLTPRRYCFMLPCRRTEGDGFLDLGYALLGLF